MASSPHSQRGPLYVGLLVIGVGLLFLINNFTGLAFNIGALFRFFWPLILIAIGLRLLIKNTTTLIATLVGVIIVTAIILATPGLLPTGSSKHSEQQANELVAGSSALRFKLDFGASNLNITDLEDSTQAYSAIFRNSGTLEETVKRDAATLAVTLQAESDHFDWQELWQQNRDREAQVAINSSLPVEFELDGGASKNNLDFSNILLQRLKLDIGAAETVLKLGARTDLDATIDAGASKLTLLLPQSAGVEIIADNSFGSGNFQAAGFNQTGNVYRSGDFNVQPHRITIRLDAGASSTNVVWY